MRFFAFTWRNLFRRPIRSALTIVGLGVAVAAVVALVGISDGFSRQYQKLYASRGIDLVVQRVGSSAELNNGLPDALGDRIRKLPHVAAVMGGLMDVVSFPDHDLVAVIINGWRPGSSLFDALKILPGGRLPRAGDHHKVIIGEVLAANLGKKVGDTIRIYDTDVRIIGIFESKSVYENGAIVTLLSDMQEFMNRPRQVTGFILRTDIPKDRSPAHQAEMLALRKRIEGLAEGIAAMPSNEFIENVGQIKLAKAVAWTTSVIALVIGAIGMLNTMVMSVYERVREIGTLRAIGWRNARHVDDPQRVDPVEPGRSGVRLGGRLAADALLEQNAADLGTHRRQDRLDHLRRRVFAGPARRLRRRFVSGILGRESQPE